MPGYLPINEELRELVSLLKSHRVEFIVVGAHALAFYGIPRFTEDIDFFISRTKLNVKRLAAAFEEFGVVLPLESQEALVNKQRGVIFLGHKPNRADFLNFLDGVDYESADRSKVSGAIAGQSVFFISLKDYATTKKATGRPKDIGDLAMLRAILPNEDI
jgi:predicted nucleotidyltransferase